MKLSTEQCCECASQAVILNKIIETLKFERKKAAFQVFRMTGRLLVMQASFRRMELEQNIEKYRSRCKENTRMKLANIALIYTSW